MTVLKMKYFPFILIGIVILVIVSAAFQKKYFEWIKKYWFREPSFKNALSRIFYLVGFIVLLISLLDFRGRPTKIESNIPDQKTIIIIDSSSSMLVEDVRPNRFERSLLIARHFIKRSAGHQIAVVVFSDTQKRLIPFTDDLDLLDARVAALSEKNIGQGGSNIFQAIRESIQYFKTDSKSMKEPEGNVLLLTDSEDNGALESFKLPPKVNLAAIGVGTAKGGRIPMRGPKGRLRGFKMHQGKEVISRLNENFLKKLGAQSNNYKYWIALSYSMPTDEVLRFFGKIHELSLKKGTTTIQPVYGHYVVGIAIIFFILSTIFNLFNTWKPLAMLLICLLSGLATIPSPVQAQEKEENYYTEEDLILLEKLRNGELDYIAKLDLASEFMKKQHVKESITIMEEVRQYKSSLPPQAMLNLGTAYMMAKNFEKGLKILSSLRAESKPEMQKIIDANVNKFIQSMHNEEKEKKKQEQQQQQQNKDQKNQQDQEKQQQQKNSEGEGEQKKKDQKGKEGKDKEEKKKEEKKKEEKGKEKDKKDDEGKDGEKKKKKQPKPQSLKEREDEIRKNRKMVKIPAILKQIMSDDRNLQQRYWKTSTDENNRDKKDW